MIRDTLCYAVAALLLLLVTGEARAAKPSAKKKSVGRVLRIDNYVISGRIQKPQAFYFLSRSNLNFKALELKKSFIPKIYESVNKGPF